jgi:hypothetical protein
MIWYKYLILFKSNPTVKMKKIYFSHSTVFKNSEWKLSEYYDYVK